MVIFIYILVGFLLVMGSALAAWLRIRRYRARLVLQTVAGIVSQNLPLGSALRATAAAERKKLRTIYSRLALRLELGDELSTALRVALPACPGEYLGALQGAERGGTLPAVLRTLAARARRDFERRGPQVPLWYSFVLLVALPLVLVFVLVLIVPKFVTIFNDFDTRLPGITMALIAFWSRAADYAPLLLLGVFALFLLVLQSFVARHFFTRLPDRLQPFFALTDGLAWSLPGLRQMARDHAWARQLPLMHTALRSGQDLPEAARQGGCAAVNVFARRRLLQWAERLENGDEPVPAARHCGFPPPVLQALAAVRTGGDLAVRLEYLAEYYQSLHQHWRRVLAGILAPAVVITYGLIVGYVVVALFLPLITLIQSVLLGVD